ncbi:TlrC/CarA/OleB/SrmB family ABC-F type ribosomal protection protein [Nocardiopsis lambiniae]|uniref:TlrC/CarA/OleB/SrmB family ABC-F type ribosomal protection protein n=1 Tax=Nocardiopsis lambiniae TaxID=3075539 RepID=A0ABU2MAP9_9ACTN|nr:TlrC/CarA/OleB/SrmB family ABC-F type ribosomal protection protein [Nocardiopsis sp. DSM 44743]MDT0329748.1 TlrC/CarA/OleB/SrmB family ABC-F type ribosomal protection protein [Nocardiopsis sp. DSM 44743]
MPTPPVRSTARVTLTEVVKRYGDHTVLDRVSLSIAPGERVGVIGDNGSGKSTLLRLLSGEEEPDNGEMTVIAPGGIGHLPQTLERVGSGTVGDAIDDALSDLREMEARLRDREAELGAAGPEGLAAYGDLLSAFEARGGYEADARVDAGLHGLGLPNLDRGRPLRTLSGGERSRLALAAVLAADPELLLLDEPTNDLDDRAVAWLEQRLRTHRGTVVAVTHDRAFLAGVTGTVLEVDHEQRRVNRYGNGYDGFLSAKAAARARWIREYDAWRAELARQRRLAENNVAALQAIPRKVDKAAFGHGGFRMRGRAHGAMSRIRQAKERAERLIENPVAPPPVPLEMTASFGTAVSEDGAVPPVELEGVRVDHRLAVPALTLAPGERVLVTGPNGAGKTTLLRVMVGELAPDSGRVARRGRVGHLRQEDGVIVPGRTVLQAYAAGRPGAAEEHRDELAALGLFRPREMDRSVESLSVGQRRRIEVARLTSDSYDLLLLDEPTNHLSPGLVEDLEEALSRYRGALVIVTHDRRTRERFTGRRLEMRGGMIVADTA